MKKLLLVVGCLTVAFCAPAYAHPHGFHGYGRPHWGGWHHHHGGWWGRGGRNFWPGFVGGVVGGALINHLTTPTVVTTPVVTTPVVTTPVVTTPVVTAPVVTTPATTVQSVWVEGRYVDQVQANGTVVRVWVPGHYEQRTVIVQ